MNEQEIVDLIMNLERAAEALRGRALRQTLALKETLEQKYKINQNANQLELAFAEEGHG